MKRIKLTKGKYAIVDDEDYLYLIRFKWRYGKTGHAFRSGGKMNRCWNMYMEEIIKSKKGYQRYVFKNKNALDLRKKNIELRTFANASIGQGKCKPLKTSKYRGVCWDKRSNCWCAYVNWSLGHKDKRKRGRWIKYFKNEKEAAKQRNKKAFEIYGELAFQNKI